MEPRPMTDDEGRRAEAWWRLRDIFARGDYLGTSAVHKAGRNDLSRWKAFGGTLDRPAPPAPMYPPPCGIPLPAYCAVPVFVGLDLAADNSGGHTPAPPELPMFQGGRPTIWFIDEMLGLGLDRRPCGECHLKPSELCDVCGAVAPAID